MDVSKAEKARLGAFVLGSLTLLAGALFYLVGRKVFTHKVPYFTRMEESVSGVELGSPVKQNGVDVGVITAITTDSSDITRTIVRFDVAKGTPIKQDMIASLGSYGITGLKYIEIRGGSYASSDVAPGGELRSEMSTLGKITVRADSIAYKIDRLLGNVLAITESQNRQHLDRLIKSSADLSASLDTLARDFGHVRPGKRVDAILGQLEDISKELHAKVKKSEIEQTIQSYKQAADGITEVAKKIDLTVMRVQEDLTQTMSNMKETMKNMNTFSRQIKENPSVLLRGEEKKERGK
jgi:phospholipid/cholesterol/gamma-HCH transport system substrate-binding protein